ncbi:MAG: UDP-N-acetylmuramoyl-L-alanyl-D-glutamate--2,6-diaminopimelate ligase, partial [Chloroflexi bacterium]
MKLEVLFRAARIPVPEGAGERDVRSIAYDSRRVGEGGLFVAIEGFHRDGHEFASDAAARGAVAIVAQRDVPVGVPVAVVADSRIALADLASEFFDHPT